jgi:hypothetical protein
MMAGCDGLVRQVATGLVYRARTIMTEGSAAGRPHTFTVLGAYHRHRVILIFRSLEVVVPLNTQSALRTIGPRSSYILDTALEFNIQMLLCSPHTNILLRGQYTKVVAKSLCTVMKCIECAVGGGLIQILIT